MGVGAGANGAAAAPSTIGVALADLEPSPSRAVDPSRPPPPDRVRPNLWDTLKSNVGKDLSRITLPVYFNEPLTFVQRLVEDVEYSELLDRAADPSTTDPMMRAGLVAAFLVSTFSTTAERTAKPFNPMLGETFEVVDHDRKFAAVVEQVSHHPPVSALHAESPGRWSYHTTAEVRDRFTGNSIEVWPEGLTHVHLHSHNEHYVYQKPHTNVHNIILGDLWLENVGTVIISELNHGSVQVKLRFKKYSWFGDPKAVGDIEGSVSYMNTSSSSRGSAKSKSSAKGKSVKLSGSWKEYLCYGNQELWRVSKHPPKDLTAGYTMTSWAWSLNAPVADSAKHILPRTDSRHRPDLRAHEDGEDSVSLTEKVRLEQKQRAAKADRDAQQAEHKPRWFNLVRREGSPDEWQYNGEYFQARAAQAWPDDLPDIF